MAGAQRARQYRCPSAASFGRFSEISVHRSRKASFSGGEQRQDRPFPILRSGMLSSAFNVMLLVPGEPDDQEIIVRAFLFDPFEVITQFAVSHEQAQPFAFIAVAIFIQDFFDVHIPLLQLRYQVLRPDSMTV
jgi:hypothetical protein